MKPALLFIDLQRDYLATPGLLPPADTLVARATVLLDGCRKHRIPVIHIWTTIHRDDDRRLPHWRRADRWICVAGTAGHKPPDALRPLDGEAVIHKTGYNPFADGEMEMVLQRMQCDTVILAGLHLHACVRTTAMECLERGYYVYIVEDVVAGNDPIHAAAACRWLSQRCTVFESGASVLALLDKRTLPPLVHRSPRCTDDVLFEVPIAGASEVASAVEAAQSAGPDWRRTPFSMRRCLIETVASRLDEAASDLARQMAVEIGKPLSYGLEEVRRAVENLRDVTRCAAAHLPEKQENAGMVRYQQLNLVAVISAWNNPVAIPLGKIAPALAYGNTVVWKAAPAATHIAQTVLRLLQDAGVPRDAVRLLTGDRTTARLLVADPNVDGVTLTGSIQSGYSVQEICAKRMAPCQAELGGNNAAIVWDDTDIGYAAAQVAWGAFAFAGQRCTANRRVIVHTPRFESLLRELETATQRLTWDDPLKEATEIGPVISIAKRDEVAAMIGRIQTSGDAHRVVLLHEARAEQQWAKVGAYLRPAIICCDRPEHPVVQEETMAPLLVVQRADDFEQALALCNGVRQGLICSLFSSEPDLQRRFLEKARAGVLKFNASTAGVDVTLPFGGWKESGIGPPEHGEGDRCFYTRIQTVYGKAGIRCDGSREESGR